MTDGSRKSSTELPQEPMIVGEVPRGLPRIALPGVDLESVKALLVPALLISIVGYVESISVALTLAAKRRQRVDPDQELIALGASNAGAALSGGFPVTGGFARSVVNFEAGAETPAAGAFTAVGIAVVTMFFTPLLHFLQIPGTAHFRNVARHGVVTDPEILSLRVDESLYFPNARFLEDRVNDAVAAGPAIRHVILECPGVNGIDWSALESLEAIHHRLKDAGIALHLSGVKGPVMDRLKRSHLLEELDGRVHLTQYEAVASINPELAPQTLEAHGADRDQPGDLS